MASRPGTEEKVITDASAYGSGGMFLQLRDDV